MSKNNITGLELERIVKQRNIILIVSGCLVITSLLLAITLISSSKTIILIPNSLSTSTEVNSRKASIEYLEAFSRDVIYLMLNATPDNAGYAAKQILKITHPSFHGVLEHQLAQRGEELITKKISIYFSGQEIVVNPDINQVLIKGRLITLLGKEAVSEEEKTYSVSYEYSGFGLLISDFHEVKKRS